MISAEDLSLSDLPEMFDWGVNGRPGVKVVFAPDEYLIGQALDDGFTISWTTPAVAAEAIGPWLDIEDFRTTAVAVVQGNDFVELEQTQIFPFLSAHDCAWIRLRRHRQGDDVYYLHRSPDTPNELAIVSRDVSVVSPADQMEQLCILIAATGSRRVQAGLEAFWPVVAGTVQPRHQRGPTAPTRP